MGYWNAGSWRPTMVKIKNYECTICGKPLDWDELIDGDFCTECFEGEEEWTTLIIMPH